MSTPEDLLLEYERWASATPVQRSELHLARRRIRRASTETDIDLDQDVKDETVDTDTETITQPLNRDDAGKIKEPLRESKTTKPTIPHVGEMLVCQVFPEPDLVVALELAKGIGQPIVLQRAGIEVRIEETGLTTSTIRFGEGPSHSTEA